jgi:two-component system response regulator AtoC
MRQVRESIRKFQDWDGSVLILGESGTGKELVARALHIQGRRRAKPFAAINCASVPETLMESMFFGHRRGSFTGAFETSVGKFEAVGEGTIFLDEIGDMPLKQQASLLRVLEYRRFTPIGETKERECRARFVFATNRNLLECVRAGTFREDLFYRINVANVNLPPLRARLDDLSDLVTYYCSKIATELGKPSLRLSEEALSLFQTYDWPGNVRELRNILESSAIGLERNVAEITVADLPAELQAAEIGCTTPEIRHEREELIRALQRSGGNQTHAARILGVHRNTVRARMRQYGLEEAQKTEGGASAL